MDNKLDVMPLMTDQMKAVVRKQKELVEDAFATDVGYDEMRANYIKERRFWNEGGPVMSSTEEMALEGPAGPFRVRLYRPTASVEARPAIVYIHGGGFVVGNCDTHDRVCRLIAAGTDAVVASVDYHLSPESKFPTNIRECALAARHIHEHGAELGIDSDDISLAGDSGGAVLSMATNLWLRDEVGDNAYVKALLLYYGYYGLRDSCSRRLFGSSIDGLSKEDLAYYDSCWIGDLTDEALGSPYYDMLSNDLKTSMPGCYIASAGLDPLRDDSACLHAILDEMGVPNVYENFEGVLHAYIHHTRMLDEANVCIEHSVDFWKRRHEFA